MKRRAFIQKLGATVTIPALLKGMPLKAIPMGFGDLPEEGDRILVLIQLNGGNDGLNTVIPLDQYRNLFHARENVIIPENKILPVSETIGFHPALTGLKSLFDQGTLEIVQGVGYKNQNRSHFRSMEIWSTALTGGESDVSATPTGWLGRYFEDLYPDFPNGYPNEQYKDPFAISIGHHVSETCQGLASNFSMALANPFSLKEVPQSDSPEEYGAFFSDELKYVQAIIRQTNGYGDRILAAANQGTNTANYPDTKLGEQLAYIALLIAGGLKTRIYVASLGGFDTHAGQVESGDTTKGNHASLLSTLSDAIKAFQNDLQQLGLEKRVIGMTFSEFGRQIRSNGSNGTDHGAAAPLFLFGSCVRSQILGENPEIPEQVEVQEAVPMQYDFRDLYGTLLMDWLEFPLEQVKQILFPDFQPLPLLLNCGITSVDRPSEVDPIHVTHFPNPFRNWIQIRFPTGNERVYLSVFNALGCEVEVLVDQFLPAGHHNVRFDGRRLPAGSYFYRLVLGNGRQVTKRILKM